MHLLFGGIIIFKLYLLTSSRQNKQIIEHYQLAQKYADVNNIGRTFALFMTCSSVPFCTRTLFTSRLNSGIFFRESVTFFMHLQVRHRTSTTPSLTPVRLPTVDGRRLLSTACFFARSSKSKSHRMVRAKTAPNSIHQPPHRGILIYRTSSRKTLPAAAPYRHKRRPTAFSSHRNINTMPAS